MNILIIAIAALVWVVLGVIGYGIEFAYLQRGFPAIAERDYESDKLRASTWIIIGPFNIISTLLAITLTGGKFHGFKWW